MNVLRKWSKPSPPAGAPRLNMEQFRSLSTRSSPCLLLPPSTTKRSTPSSPPTTPIASLPFAPPPFVTPVFAASFDPNDPPPSPVTLSSGETESEARGEPTRLRGLRALEPARGS